MGKYYAMTQNVLGKLYFYMDRILCYASEEWEEAREGIVTEPEILEEWEGENGQKCATVRARMVETEEFDWENLDMFQVDEIITFSNFSVVGLRGSSLYGYWAEIPGEGLQPIEIQYRQRDDRDKRKQDDVFFLLEKRLKEKYEIKSEEEIMAAIIRNFAEKTMDAADCVEVFERTVFQVSYPGWFRDWCQDFVIEPNGKSRKWVLVPLRDRLQSKKQYSMEMILKEMDRLGISAGEDSGDAVEGVTQEERKYLTTRRLPGGGLLVMFKAETFSYELLQNENLRSKVCVGMGNWLYRMGEPNAYRSLMD